MRTAHPVYLYSPGGSFVQAPDGRLLLAQAGYVGNLGASIGTQAATARADANSVAKATGTQAAKAPPTYKAKG